MLYIQQQNITQQNIRTLVIGQIYIELKKKDFT
jgi:hypothetical protein